MKVKIRFPVVAAVAVGVLLLIHLMLGLSYMNQQEEQSSLKSEIEEKQLLTDRLPKDTLNLEKQLAAAQALLAMLQCYYVDQPSSAVVLGAIQQYAGESEVEVLSMQSSPPATEESMENTYQVLPFNLEVEGSLPQLVTFLLKLEHGTLKNLVIGKPQAKDAGETYILTLDLSIYMPPFPQDMFASPSTPETEGRLADFQQKIDEVWEVGEWEPLINVLSLVRSAESGSQRVDEMLYLAHVCYAGQLIEEERLEEAVEQFEEALAIEPDGAEAKEGLQSLLAE